MEYEPDLYPDPELKICPVNAVTEIFAVAPLPVPPIKETLLYVPGS